MIPLLISYLNEFSMYWIFSLYSFSACFILKERFLIGKTQMEIASSLGISQAQISRIEKNAINNIKKLVK